MNVKEYENTIYSKKRIDQIGFDKLEVGMEFTSLIRKIGVHQYDIFNQFSAFFL